MKLMLLYGPPAVGKFTVSKELQKLTGFKNFHNHAVVDAVNEIFGWENPARGKLEYEIRARIVEEAAASGVDLIVTGVIARNNKFLYQGMIDSYRRNGGESCLVQLRANKDVSMGRVEHKSRVNKINSREKLSEFLNQYPESLEKFGEGEQLVIDTTKTTPQEAAQRIVDFYKL